MAWQDLVRILNRRDVYERGTHARCAACAEAEAGGGMKWRRRLRARQVVWLTAARGRSKAPLLQVVGSGGGAGCRSQRCFLVYCVHRAALMR